MDVSGEVSGSYMLVFVGTRNHVIISQQDFYGLASFLLSLSSSFHQSSQIVNTVVHGYCSVFFLLYVLDTPSPHIQAPLKRQRSGSRARRSLNPTRFLLLRLSFASPKSQSRLDSFLSYHTKCFDGHAKPGLTPLPRKSARYLHLWMSFHGDRLR